MEALKLGTKLDSSDSQQAIAISAGSKDYTYGHLLQSAFQILKFLQNGKGETASNTTGAADRNKVEGPEFLTVFRLLFLNCICLTL